MKKILIFLLLSMTLVVANTVDAASRVERDLEEMKRRLEAVEQATIGKGSSRLAELEASLEATARAQAETQAELTELRVELQQLRGAFDDFQHSRRELHDLLTMMREEMEVKLNALQKRLTKLEQAPPAPAQPKAEAKEPGVNPAAEYEAALQLIRKDEEFTHGRRGLEAFLEKYPEHELAVNARYWIGEAYYGEGKYENAILQFQDILQNHPQHNKAPAAQLKQALAFEALGDKATAKVLLKKVGQNYSNAPEAKKAKEFLARMK